jgi:putative transcriptional regulator
LKGFAEALQRGDKITERFTCRKIILDLKPTPYNPALVKKTREILGVSQALFAHFLGVSVKTVHSWEQGSNTPNDMACRFMDEIRRDPGYWQGRLREAMVAK